MEIMIDSLSCLSLARVPVGKWPFRRVLPINPHSKIECFSKCVLEIKKTKKGKKKVGPALPLPTTDIG